MSEGEVITQLVNFTNIVLVGVSVIFTVVSSCIVALNYFIGSANMPARVAAYAFITLILAMLMFVMSGAQAMQIGLIERLHELQQAGTLTAAGRAAIGNATGVDDVLRTLIWIGLAATYIALGYLTFLHKWTPDAIPVMIEQRAPS